MAFDPVALEQIIAAFITLISLIFAYWKKMDADVAKAETVAVNAYFDPADETVVTPPASVPARSYIMSDETKRWVLASESDADKSSILAQIAAAEANKLPEYQIHTSQGFYNIEYGLIRGSGKGVK